jgi:Na+/H+ antiporter NhaD/arsenite permease-like protein
MQLPVIIAFAVFFSIATRQILSIKFGLKLEIWQIMLCGAIGVLITGQITPYEAAKAINMDVMLFLLGVFIIGGALEESGYIMQISGIIFGKVKSMNQLIITLIFIIGFTSAFLMNDTMAIIGVPLILYLSKNYKISPRLLILTLAFSVTTGSIMSPIGNPQNLLIAIDSPIPDPFITFPKYLFLPTIINLVMIYLVLKIFFHKEFNVSLSDNTCDKVVKDTKMVLLAKLSLSLFLFLITIRIISSIMGFRIIQLWLMPLIASIPLLLSGKKFANIIKNVDWRTLIFFMAMFILTKSVQDTRFFQSVIDNTGLHISSLPTIFSVSIISSQLLTNIPFVAFYLPLLIHVGGGIKEYMALSAASTIAGNFTLLGAASNVIIIQNVEKRGESITFLDFAKVGIPLTVVNAIVYYIFLSL